MGGILFEYGNNAGTEDPGSSPSVDPWLHDHCALLPWTIGVRNYLTGGKVGVPAKENGNNP